MFAKTPTRGRQACIMPLRQPAIFENINSYKMPAKECKMPCQIKRLLPRDIKIMKMYIECKQQKDIAKEVRLIEQLSSHVSYKI